MKTLILMVVIYLGFLVYAYHEYAVNKAYQEGYSAGLRVPQQCTPTGAAMWWTNTTNMRAAKRKLCS